MVAEHSIAGRRGAMVMMRMARLFPVKAGGGRRAGFAEAVALFAFLLVFVIGLFATGAAARPAVILTIEGAIGPATADYVKRGIENSANRGARIVVLVIDTPGGLDTSMREIVQAILAAPIPVASYVSPGGARAASAGTYILYASHIAAMAPATNLGAATPVTIGGGLPLPGRDGQERPESGKEADKNANKDGERAPAPKDASESKAINDAVAYIRSLAELRGRNADWAEEAVRSAASLSANEALARNVIDIVATDLADLFARLDGRQVALDGGKIEMDTRAIAIEHVEPDWRTLLLAAITNPNVALILMMIGIYGLIFEFMNPGSLIPGTIGAICLLTALYALAALPVNFAGAALMILGLALMVAEAFTPSFGILGIGGAVAFALGGTILIDTEAPGFAISWSVLGPIAAVSLGFTLIVVRLAYTSHRRKIMSGSEELIGAKGEVVDWSGTAGHVRVHSERWNAVADRAFAPGQEIEVTAIDGLTLTIAPHAAKSRAGEETSHA